MEKDAKRRLELAGYRNAVKKEQLILMVALMKSIDKFQQMMIES